MATRTILSLALLFVTNAVAQAWSAGGHRVMANIAYDRMKPEMRAKVVALLKKHPRFRQEFGLQQMQERLSQADQDRWIFLQASIWSDLIRSTMHDRPTWHYINLQYFLTEQDKRALANELDTNLSMDVPADLPKDDVPRANLNVVQAIKLSLTKLEDDDTPDEVKAVYVCWLMHLVTGLHQPLHSTGLFSRKRFNTSGGDRGGNSIPTKQNGNLHALWDGLLGRELNLNEVRGRAARITLDEELATAAKKATEDLTPETWTAESHKLCRDFVYTRAILDAVGRDGELAAFDLPESYLKSAGRHAQRRAAQAGFRLAALLEKVLAE